MILVIVLQVRKKVMSEVKHLFNQCIGTLTKKDNECDFQIVQKI